MDSGWKSPACTITWLAMVWPALKFRFDVDWSSPLANRLRCDAAVGFVTVTFRSSAPHWNASHGDGGRTIVRVSPGAMACPPAPRRVSQMRYGAWGWNFINY